METEIHAGSVGLSGHPGGDTEGCLAGELGIPSGLKSHVKHPDVLLVAPLQKRAIC